MSTPGGITRAEYLAWCKQRALRYVEAGELENAVTSMASDLEKHPETKGHAGSTLGLLLLMGGQLSTPEQVRRFIVGFN